MMASFRLLFKPGCTCSPSIQRPSTAWVSSPAKKAGWRRSGYCCAEPVAANAPDAHAHSNALVAMALAAMRLADKAEARKALVAAID